MGGEGGGGGLGGRGLGGGVHGNPPTVPHGGRLLILVGRGGGGEGGGEDALHGGEPYEGEGGGVPKEPYPYVHE